MSVLNGKLVHPEAGSWNGYRATAAWTVPAREDDPAASKFRSASVDRDGRFTLELPGPDDVAGAIDLVANAPSGELVLRERIDAPSVDVSRDFTVKTYLAPVIADEVVPEGAGRRPRLFGRALSFDGQPARAGETVVLWGIPQNGSDRDAWPFLVVELQPGGFFAGDRPTRPFARVYGTVAGGPAIAVALVERGLVPDKVVLVGAVPTGPAPKEDCDCETLAPPRVAGHAELTATPEVFASDLGGRCVDLTIPNRALEEVRWNALVRISEPTIRAFTLDDDRRLPDALVDDLLDAVLPVRASTLARADGIARAPMRGEAELPPASDEAPRPSAKSLVLDARNVARAMRPGETIDAATLLDADRSSRFLAVRDLLRKRAAQPPMRPLLGSKYRMDWDETPTMHQATSIAHGHVLTFRQTWHADGYSLGDLLYSLPLAPGQKKQIATVDWDRRDTVLRLSDRESRETLSAMIERDRDVEEIVRGALDERVRAGSSATRSSVAGGFGLAIGPVVLGGAGGSAWASSNAWQTSSRDVAGSTLQQVRDRTVQSASAARSQRSTVVQSVRQGESVRAETQTVANYNHCHAMTVQYFEVLRHFQLTHEIVGVRECLFVPFLLSEFDLGKALRWREPLRVALRRRDLVDGFAAAERVRTGWAGAHVPTGAYADDPIEWLDAEFTVQLDLPRPKDTEDGHFDAPAWGPYEHLLTRSAEEEWKLWLGVVTANERDGVWARRLAPRIARKLLDRLELTVVLPDASNRQVPIDASMVSTWRPGTPQLVTIRPRGALPSLRRSDISSVVFSSGVAVPSPATVMIERGTMRYRTPFLHHTLFAERLVQNDLGTSDDVEIAVRLDRLEKRRPRDDDRRRATALLDHLNAHLEYYHRAIWLAMHPNRRYLLLDGFEAPNAGGRSVASVVENRLIGVVGNCLVFPVAPGVHLDPNTDIPDDASGDLLAYYNADPPPPVRVSVPTRGVFAEAILGSCNSCEVKDDSRFWRWEDAPIPDRPPELGTVSTASRRRAPTALRPDAFSTPLVGLQSLPDLPAPTALKAAMDLIGTPDLFRDLTGVDVNIAHAAKALTSALSTADFFGGEAAKLAKQQFLSKHTDRVLAAIKDAVDKKLITEEMGRDLTMQALGGSVGSQTQDEASATEKPVVEQVLNRAARSDNAHVKVERPSGSVEIRTGTDPAAAAYDYTVQPPVQLVLQTDTRLCWAAAGATLMNWRDQVNRTLDQAAAELGGAWPATVAANTPLGPTELRAYASALGLVEEGAASSTARGILRLLQDHGPLWVVHDEFAENDKLVHARIVVGIAGEGNGDQAIVKMLDPASSSLLQEDFATFSRRLASEDTVRFGMGILRFA